MSERIMPEAARWNPTARHDMAMVRIERAIEQAHGHPDVSFTAEDLEEVAELMRLRCHADDTPSTTRHGEPSSRPSVRKSIDPGKRYTIKSTGEVVTGAELLRRRGQA